MIVASVVKVESEPSEFEDPALVDDGSDGLKGGFLETLPVVSILNMSLPACTMKNGMSSYSPKQRMWLPESSQ